MRMIDADALIKEITEARCVNCDRRKGMKKGKMTFVYEIGEAPCRACDVMDMVDTLEEAPTVAMDTNVLGKWTSVKDRLPEDSRYVLVCNDDGKYMIAFYSKESFGWYYKYTNYDFDLWDVHEQGPVCYWMPLPTAPEPLKEVAGDE